MTKLSQEEIKDITQSPKDDKYLCLVDYHIPYLLEIAYRFGLVSNDILCKYNIQDDTVDVMQEYYKRVYDNIDDNGENKPFLDCITDELLADVYRDFAQEIHGQSDYAGSGED